MLNSSDILLKMNILELYSGIGGMHLALKESGLPGKVICSIDINNVANNIYKHNFSDTPLANRNICGLTADFINKLGVNTILMSPPCQPFTRNGLQADIDDPRTDSFCHLLTLLPQLNINRILMENVKGFEKSHMRKKFVDALEKLGFAYQEFLLSPAQIGVPNSRCRYYCLAKKLPEKFGFDEGPLMEHLPFHPESTACDELNTIIQSEIDVNKYLLPDKILRRRSNLLDICYPNSTRSCCFTKAYSRYLEGTGSVFTDRTECEVRHVFEQLQNYSSESDEYLKLIRALNLRYFTPREVCRLMCFPETFSFPDNISDRQCYMVLGNSINVKVVSELIKLLK